MHGSKPVRHFSIRKSSLAKLFVGASLIGLVGCEGILGGIQDPGSGSGCTLIVNILPVCDGGGGGAAATGKQVKPEELLKDGSSSSLAWLEALLRRMTDQV